MMTLAQRAHTFASHATEEMTDQYAVKLLQEKFRTSPTFAQIIELVNTNPNRARNEAQATLKLLMLNEPWNTFLEPRKKQIAEEVLDAMFGMGPLEELLHNPLITEIMINTSSHLFVEQDGVIREIPSPFTSEEEIMTLVDKILGPIGRRVDELSPMVDARLSNGYRVNVVLPPISPDGIIVTIRKFSEEALHIDDLIQSKSIEPQVATYLKNAITTKQSIAVCGGTGSGKTTLLNALSYEIPDAERVITIEDLAELRFEHDNIVRLEARPQNAEGTGEVTIRQLVHNALRMRPDRIVVGECRGAEALDMLQAMNTGHDGSLTTLHANSPQDAISRLVTMVRFAVDLPVEVIETNIGSALDLIVQVKRGACGSRFLSSLSIVTVATKENARNPFEIIDIYTRASFDDVGVWASTD